MGTHAHPDTHPHNILKKIIDIDIEGGERKTLMGEKNMPWLPPPRALTGTEPATF